MSILYTFPGNFRAFKALIAAEYNDMALKVEDFTEEAKNMTPLGKAPVLQTKEVRRTTAETGGDGRGTGGRPRERASLLISMPVALKNEGLGASCFVQPSLFHTMTTI